MGPELSPELISLVHTLVFKTVYAVVQPFVAVLRSDSIYYWPYLLSALAVALVGHVLHGARGGILRDTFSRRVWWSPSSRADYRFYLVNTILHTAVVVPFLVTGAQIGDSVAAGLSGWFGPVAAGSLGPDWLVRGLYTAAFFAAYDFGRFLAHWAQHVNPILWQFHKVHHSAECLTPVTSSRAHPVDLVVMALGGNLGAGAATGIFLWAGGGAVGLYSFLSLHALIALYNLVGLLRHSHVWLSYGPLEKVFVSPAMHQLHHSALPHHFDRNCGFCFAFWDRLFGTWCPATGNEHFPMGLGDGTDGQWHSVWRLYWWPFRDAFRVITGRPPVPATK